MSSLCNSSGIKHLPDIHWKPTFGILMGIVSLLATVENLVIIVVFYKYPVLRTASNKILMSITVADLSTGLIVCPLYASALLNENFAGICALTLIRRYSATVFIAASTLSVGFLAIDRMQRIRKLQEYKLESKILYGVLLPVWIIPVGLPLVALVSDKIYATVASAIGVIALLIVIVSYVGLLVVLAKHREQLGEEFQEISLRRERKAAKSVVLLVSCYLVTLLPLIIEKILFATKYSRNMDKSEYAKVGAITILLCCSSSVVNPIIYVSKVSDLKEHLGKLVALRTRRGTLTVTMSTIP